MHFIPIFQMRKFRQIKYKRRVSIFLHLNLFNTGYQQNRNFVIPVCHRIMITIVNQMDKYQFP